MVIIMDNRAFDFLCPRLQGKRFEQHGLPLDILKDFAVLDELVKTVARSIYKQENDGKRVPRNFMDDFSLQITGIEAGSTITRISLIRTKPCLFATIGQEYAEKARDRIVHTIEAAANGKCQDDVSCLSQPQLSLFNRFGCSLREDEAIIFSGARDGRDVPFTAAVRQKLLESAAIEKYSQAVSLYGAIAEVDQYRKTFTLNLIDGQRLSGIEYNDGMVDDVLEAFTGYAVGRKVLLLGMGVYSKGGKLDSLESTDEVRILDDMDSGYRLAEIGSLKDGWMDGKGKSFDKQKLLELAELFRSYYSLEHDPYLYPTADGTIQAEWDVGKWRISMEIELEGMTGDFYALELDLGLERNLAFDLKDGIQWSRLCQAVKNPEVLSHE